MKIFKKKIAFIGWDCNKMIKKRNNNNRHTNAYMHIKKYSLCCFIWMPSAVGRIDMYVWLLNNISWKATAVICAAASKQMPNRFHFLFCGNRTVQCSAYCAAYICVNRQKEMLMITNTKIIWFLLNLQIKWIKTKQHKTTYFHVVEWRMGAFHCGNFFFYSLSKPLMCGFDYMSSKFTITFFEIAWLFSGWMKFFSSVSLHHTSFWIMLPHKSIIKSLFSFERFFHIDAN